MMVTIYTSVCVCVCVYTHTHTLVDNNEIYEFPFIKYGMNNFRMQKFRLFTMLFWALLETLFVS